MKRILCLLCAAALALSACAAPKPAPTAQSEAVFETETTAAPATTGAPAQTWTDAVQGSIPAVTGQFTVTMLSVGKADCFVLQTQNHVVLVDTGTRDSAEKVLEWLKVNNIFDIDVMIVSHFDKDHVGGAASIIKELNVKQVYTADYEGSGKRYDKYLEAAADRAVPVQRVNEDTGFTLDDVYFELKPAGAGLITASLANVNSSGEPDENDCSLVLAAWHGNNSFAFLGDAEAPEIEELLGENIGPFTFVKAPHHGRFESNSAALFGQLSPQLVFVTDDPEEGAEPALLRVLEQVGAQTALSTDGDIQCISNGDSLTTQKL